MLHADSIDVFEIPVCLCMKALRYLSSERIEVTLGYV